ncbi:Signal transduction histidine kinase [Paenibacillus sp. UNCCL117]|uniref:HAMP domain-containing sensor histidine kinase n=1 Tax=unclassified Paenibacillus TaxID=185978 RepID=UPI00087FB82E|nr:MULTISPECIES: HAMP domain-containing sensor histidine kinase [unclassified Paenibacillus]SDE14414.1 Signal transduction histidine kinase [Paenibacillus sp. cl123]SFW60590.1 Signal transduction histidine kinase [Paenibacillus sp. UNCCL117]
MIRSLYQRVVLTFLVAVILGLTVAFFVMLSLYRDTFNAGIQRQFSDTAADIAGVLGRVERGQWDELLREQHWISVLRITLIAPSGEAHAYGGGPVQPEPMQIPPDALRQVRSGQSYASTGIGSLYSRMYGAPVRTEEGVYGLFIQPGNQSEPDDLGKTLLTTLLIALAAGSLFILVAARYLVNPLNRMTQATRRMAKGDFNVQLKLRKRRDELGELARSFDHMAVELRQLERMRQDFVANVSHEIQSPLTSISGFSKLMRNPGMPEEEKGQYLDIIETEADRLSRLTENLLKLASLDSEHHPFHPVPLRLDEQLRRIVVALEPHWSAKGLELQLELPQVKVMGDEDQLSQVWVNLLTNAVKFTPEGGSIELKLEALTDRVRVIFRDTGIGIAAEDMERIFERFYKADRSRGREKGGSGLGLAIVRKIAELHGGTVEAASEPGRGTTVTVTLPSGLGPPSKP